MKQIAIFYFFLVFTKLQAQSSFTNIAADSVLSAAVNNLNESQFYFVVQLHDNEANTTIEKNLLLSLNKRFNLRYDILEFAHSAAFLLNQYLETGDTSFLKDINPKADFHFIKFIKAFNDTVDSSNRIKFFGLDFEGRYDGKLAKKAIEIVSHKIDLPKNNALQILLDAVINSSSESEKENLTSVKIYLNDYEQNCKALLGKYYIDILLIANAQFDFSSNRDKSMLADFKLLYNELTKEKSNAKFFSSFGVGHLNLENNNGLAYRLLKSEDSPVKDNVSVIGTEYYNCTFYENKTSKESDGILNYLCKSSLIKSLNNSISDKQKSITFISKNDLKDFVCSNAANKLDGLIIVKNFGATLFWTWE